MKIAQTVIAFAVAALMVSPMVPLAAAQEATPTLTYSCDDAIAGQAAGTPGTLMGDAAGMAMGTPMAMEMEFDQLYIDMMILHHQGIIALAQASQPRLTDARLQAMAQNIIDVQSAENEELRGYRVQWYGSSESMSMDEAMMRTMMQEMPGLTGTMDEMAMQMDPQAEVAAFCAEANPDLAFIDLAIPHHEMAIEASQAAVTRAKHPEIQALAQRVIDDQQREIEELNSIRAELTGQATPATS